MSNPFVNPYQAPGYQGGPSDARNQVKGPAIALIVVSLIGIIVGLLGLAADVFLLASGAIDRLEAANDGPTSKYLQVAIRSIWGMALVAAASFVLFGAIRMVTLKSYGAARAAAVVAMIPLLGPCCILGIPFGIWAFIVLGKPSVRDAFG